MCRCSSETGVGNVGREDIRENVRLPERIRAVHVLSDINIIYVLLIYLLTAAGGAGAVR